MLELFQSHSICKDWFVQVGIEHNEGINEDIERICVFYDCVLRIDFSDLRSDIYHIELLGFVQNNAARNFPRTVRRLETQRAEGSLCKSI